VEEQFNRAVRKEPLEAHIELRVDGIVIKPNQVLTD
jgi:hypothetical protein